MSESGKFKGDDDITREKILTIIETPHDVEVLVVPKEKRIYFVKSVCVRLGICTLLGIALFVICWLLGFGLLESLYLFIAWMIGSIGIVLLLYIAKLWIYRSKRRIPTSKSSPMDYPDNELL